jgi:tRNA pseudouridine38-40 synthase
LRLDLAYDGTDFFGWARQPKLRTVQQVMEETVATVLRLRTPASLVVAGRTDTGVHATGQVAHLDVPKAPGDLSTIRRRLNGALPGDVSLHDIRLAAPGFDARFAALGRHYRYRVCDGPPNPIRRRDTVRWKRPLDVERINSAARPLLGQHDFAAYCKRRKGATTIRTLHQLEATRTVDGVVEIKVHADAFCHNQVRSMVGALLSTGEGRRAVDWPAKVLTVGVRDSLVNVAPALGLTLVAVDYPPDSELAARATQARQRRR